MVLSTYLALEHLDPSKKRQEAAQRITGEPRIVLWVLLRGTEGSYYLTSFFVGMPTPNIAM